MVFIGRLYRFKFYKGCLTQILLDSFLNTLTQLQVKMEENGKLDNARRQRKHLSKHLTPRNASRTLVLIVRNAYKKLRCLCLTFPANIYLLKFNSRNTRKRCKIYSKLTIKTPDDLIDVDVFIFKFEHISHLLLVLLLLTLNK